MNVIFLGPPGVGKGTQSLRAARHFELPHVSTGDIMRRAIADGTDLGAKVKSYLDTGQLVPDQLVIDLVDDRLGQEDCQRGTLLDGFPRTTAQAEALARLLDARGRRVDGVVQLVASAEVLQARMLARAEKEGRSDDNPETIANRLDVYERQTAPLVDFYQRAGLLKKVDGIGTPDEVFDRVREVMEGLA